MLWRKLKADHLILKYSQERFVISSIDKLTAGELCSYAKGSH